MQSRVIAVFVQAVICSMFCSVRVLLLVQAHVMAVLSSSGFVDSSAGCEGPVGLVLDTTSFYAEQGGQVADIGSLTSSSGHDFDVQDTQVHTYTCIWPLAHIPVSKRCCRRCRRCRRCHRHRRLNWRVFSCN